MYAHRRQLRVIFGVILLALAVYVVWMLTYTGTRVPPIANEQDIAPCTSFETPVPAMPTRFACFRLAPS